MTGASRVRSLVVVTAILAGAVGLVLVIDPSGDARGTAARGCRDHGWPAVTSGHPTRAPSAAAVTYTLSHRYRRWRLAVTGPAGAQLAGRVASDRRLRLVHRVAWARRHGRVISIHATGTGRSRSLRFRTPCARRLRVSFGAGSGQKVLLGASTTAPSPAMTLQRPPVTGVEGRVIRGPTCPVLGPSGCNRPAPPAPGDVRIDRAQAKDGSGGGQVKTITTDSEGRFSTDLPPGQYVLTPEQGSSSRSSRVDVTDGVTTDVTLQVDTGIR